jgi:hypothetical protein
VHEDVEGAECTDLVRDALSADVASDQACLGPERLELGRGLLGRAIAAEIPDSDAARAERSEAKSD